MASCRGRQKRTVPSHRPAVGRFAFRAFVIGLLVVLTGFALTDDLRAQDSGWVNVMDGPGDSRGSSGSAPAYNDGGWNDVIGSTPQPLPEPIAAPRPAPPEPAAEPQARPEPASEPMAKPSPEVSSPSEDPTTPEETAPAKPAPAETAENTGDNPPPAPAPPSQSLALELVDNLLNANLPAEMPPALYINNMTTVQYGGAVSMAMEGMRIFYGDMDEKQEQEFEARWQPLFEYPSQEIVSYLNQLNPLLVQFLALKAALNDCLEDFNATQLEVMASASVGDADNISAAMENAALYSLVAKLLNLRLQKVGEEITALGDPPNAVALRRRAREIHEQAQQEFFQPPVLEISPARLKAVLGKEYVFTVKVKDYERYKPDKLSIKWSFENFGPGWGKPEKGIYTVKHTFRDNKAASHQFTVQLQLYPGPKILATGVADIQMINDPGCWTLVKCESRQDQDKNLEFRTDQESRIIESAFRPESFSTGPKLESLDDPFRYQHSWHAPPQRLFPGARVELPLSVKRLHKYDKINISTEEYSKLSEAERTRHLTLKENALQPADTVAMWLLAKESDELIHYASSGGGARLAAGESEAKAEKLSFPDSGLRLPESILQRQISVAGNQGQ